MCLFSSKTLLYSLDEFFFREGLKRFNLPFKLPVLWQCLQALISLFLLLLFLLPSLQITKQQLQQTKERFQAFLNGDTQIVADEAFINAVQSYYEVTPKAISIASNNFHTGGRRRGISWHAQPWLPYIPAHTYSHMLYTRIQINTNIHTVHALYTSTNTYIHTYIHIRYTKMQTYINTYTQIHTNMFVLVLETFFQRAARHTPLISVKSPPVMQHSDLWKWRCVWNPSDTLSSVERKMSFKKPHANTLLLPFIELSAQASVTQAGGGRRGRT